MSLDNRGLINKAAISTDKISSGLLQPYQAKKFLQQTFEATALRQQIRHEIRTEKTGEIDKIGIASRILRKKTENKDDGYRAGVETSQIEYETKAVRLPWEITEETLRENIEGQNFESIVTNLMTTQLGIDLEDLDINGDEDVSATDPDYDFLKLNNGWLKQISAGGHIYDASSYNSMSLDMFYNCLQAVPNKYNNGKLRWLMSPHRAQKWELYLLNQVITSGGAVPDNMYTAPAHIPVIEVPKLPDDKIILVDPKNLIEVKTYNVKIRKTTEGKEAIMQDKRFYVVHFDLDAVIEEIDATAVMTNIPDFLNA